MRFLISVLCALVIGCANVGDVRLVDTSKGKPDFVSKIPDGHIVGFSSGAKTVEKGKNLALDDVIRQISRAIGFEIDLEFDSKTELKNDTLTREISEQLRSFSYAVIDEIEPNIKQIYFEKFEKKTRRGLVTHFYDTYMLVNFPKSRINHLRRLTLAENEKRLRYYQNLMSKGQELEIGGDFIGATIAYSSAETISKTLLKDRMYYENIAGPKLDALISSLRVVKIEENCFEIKLRATFGDGLPVSGLPMNIKLKKGLGHVPNVVFTDKNGYARVNISRMMADVKTNTISVKPRLIRKIEGCDFQIDFSTIKKKPVINASTISLESFKIAGILSKHVEQAVISVELSEINGMPILLDRYRLVAIAHYPVFMKDENETVRKDAEFFLKDPIRLNGDRQKIRLSLEKSACIMISSLMEHRKPASMQIELKFFDKAGEIAASASTDCFKI